MEEVACGQSCSVRRGLWELYAMPSPSPYLWKPDSAPLRAPVGVTVAELGEQIV